MANTTQSHAPRETTETASDSEAWKVAAAARKYHIHDGKVWSGGAGMLFSLDPLPGFASLPLAVQPMVFQAVAQYVTNRVGQVAEGDVQAAISDCLLNGKAPNANDNNAFERHYHNTVDDRVLAARKLTGVKLTTEQKAEHDKIVEATKIKNRDSKFMEFVNAGIAASRSKPITEKKRQPKAAADLSSAIEI